MDSHQGSGQSQVLQIKKWLGLNQNPDGDTKLRPGEAAELRNFKITRDGNLQIRPGTRTLFWLPGPVRGLWSGRLQGREVTVCAAGGRLWDLDLKKGQETEIGVLTDDQTSFFPFGQKLYIQNGHEYLAWDGQGLAAPVEGYRPLVLVGAPPAGGGTQLEGVNRLTGKRRARFSPDGEDLVFRLPESDIASVDYVTHLASGEALSFTADTQKGEVSLAAPPPEGVSSLEIGWDAGEDQRAGVEAMRFSEFYSGATDARVFLYGDGGGQALYSGLDYNGQPTAEYFPQLNLLDAGAANTPITGMIRHYSGLLVFKSDSAFLTSYGTLEMENGRQAAAFYTLPLNRDIGCHCPGQVRLIQNDPYTIFGGSVYRWVYNSGYASVDERSAQRVSSRVASALRQLKLEEAVTFDDEAAQEYYIAQGDTALVLGYGEDAWYRYESFPATCFARAGGKLWIGTAQGEIKEVSRQYRNDDGAPIDAFWRSGSMSFDRDWRTKYSPRLYMAMRPESGARVEVTARSDKKSRYGQLCVSSGLSTYLHMDYGHFSYLTNRQPQVRRAKLKVKKAAYYQLILQSRSASATATILSVDILFRYTGSV